MEASVALAVYRPAAGEPSNREDCRHDRDELAAPGGHGTHLQKKVQKTRSGRTRVNHVLTKTEEHNPCEPSCVCALDSVQRVSAERRQMLRVPYREPQIDVPTVVSRLLGLSHHSLQDRSLY